MRTSILHKRFSAIILLCAAAMTCGCMACTGNGVKANNGIGSTLTEQSSITNPQSSDFNSQAFTCPADQNYAARIIDGGRIELVFNNKRLANYAEDMGKKWSEPDDNIVQNIDHVVKLVMANEWADDDKDDPGRNLFMITSDGHVAVFSEMDLVERGDLACSGPLSFVSNVVDVKKKDKDGMTTIVAVSKDGKETVLKSSNVQIANWAEYHVGQYSVVLTYDWNFLLCDRGATDAPYLEGTYQPATSADLPNGNADQRQNFVAQLTTGEVRFTTWTDDDGTPHIEFSVAPNGFDIETGKDYATEY